MFIGIAGWSVPSVFKSDFPSEGSHLQRYSQVFNAVEINSSFYREHMARSYLRWASEVPENFRFSVKLAKSLLHDCGLKPKAKMLEASLDNILHLEQKLGVILIQLPGSMEFHAKNAQRLFGLIRKQYEGPLAIEPRNTSWVSKEARDLLIDYKISKVLADPERCHSKNSRILKAGGLIYYRLHGSPVIYRSSYSEEYLKNLAQELSSLKNVWCIFDNTTFGTAIGNGLELQKLTLTAVSRESQKKSKE